MLESCSTPAYLLLTAMWYKVEEQPIRIGYWSIFLGLANAFGGLLACGIGHISSGLAPWSYQSIIVGSFSAAWGIIMFFTLARSPSSAVSLKTFHILDWSTNRVIDAGCPRKRRNWLSKGFETTIPVSKIPTSNAIKFSKLWSIPRPGSCSSSVCRHKSSTAQ